MGALAYAGVLAVAVVCSVVQSTEELDKRAWTALQENQYREALTHFDELIAQEPRDASFHYGRAIALSGLLDYRAAVDALQQAVVLDPRHAASFRQLAILYSQLGKRQSAQSAYRKARSLGPVPEREKLLLARALRKADLFEDARYLLDGVDSYEATLERATVEMERGDYESAAQYLKAATAEPSTSTARAELEYARCLELLGQSEQAIRHYRRALDKDPGSGRARFRLGNLLLRLGDREEGLALLRGHEEFRQWDRKVKVLLAMVTSGTLAEAKQRQKTRELADLLMKGGAYKQAERVLRSALANEPDDPMLRLALANTLYLERRVEDAGSELGRVLSLSEPPAGAFWLQGLIHLQKEELAEAIDAYLAFLERAPDPSAGFLNQLGNLYGMSGNLEQARVYFEKAIEKDPEDPKLRLDLAAALEGLGKEEEAEEARAVARELESRKLRRK